ncbi:tyrosine-type recombinase/integrase [Bdellovibrionota bacterium FG-1]
MYIKYLEYCSKTKGLSEYTLRIRRKWLIQFLAMFPGKWHPSSVGRLSVKQVHDYMIRAASKLPVGEKRHLTSSLRDFFRFVFLMGYHQEDLSKFVPKIRMAELAHYPKGLPWNVINELLNSPDRRTLQGKRDYAILLLLSRYGVRPRQVIYLKMSDIDWKRRTILFRAIKGGKDVLVPLHKDVARAFLSYFRAGRMTASPALQEVFLTLCKGREHEGPFTTSFYWMFDRYLEKIPYSGPQWRGGPSAIRHSVASKLLSEKNSIKSIADLLGHRSVETTFIYTKVDLERLSELTFEWPEVA